MKAYFAEFKCGCVSRYARTQRELLDYCGKHGDNRRGIYPVTLTLKEWAEAQAMGHVEQ